jgi:hypothetical protein
MGSISIEVTSIEVTISVANAVMPWAHCVRWKRRSSLLGSPISPDMVPVPTSKELTASMVFRDGTTTRALARLC